MFFAVLSLRYIYFFGNIFFTETVNVLKVRHP